MSAWTAATVALGEKAITILTARLVWHGPSGDTEATGWTSLSASEGTIQQCCNRYLQVCEKADGGAARRPGLARAETRRAIESPKPEAASHRSHWPPCCPLQRPSHRLIGIRAHGTPIDFLARLRSGSHPLQPAHTLAFRARAWLRFLATCWCEPVSEAEPQSPAPPPAPPFLPLLFVGAGKSHHHKGGRRPKAEATDVHVNLNPIAANRL